MTAGWCAPPTAGLPAAHRGRLRGAAGHAPGEGEPLPLPRPHGGGRTEAEGWPHGPSMCERLELPWDYFLFVILIYTAYDTSCINEIPPSLPAATSTFESHDQAAAAAAGSERAPWHSLPLSCQDPPELPGPEADNQNSRLVLLAGSSRDPRAKAAGGLSVPLGPVAQEGSELPPGHLLTSGRHLSEKLV